MSNKHKYNVQPYNEEEKVIIKNEKEGFGNRVEQLRALTVLLKDWVQFQTPTSNSRQSIITLKK